MSEMFTDLLTSPFTTKLPGSDISVTDEEPEVPTKREVEFCWSDTWSWKHFLQDYVGVPTKDKSVDQYDRPLMGWRGMCQTFYEFLSGKTGSRFFATRKHPSVAVSLTVVDTEGEIPDWTVLINSYSFALHGRVISTICGLMGDEPLPGSLFEGHEDELEALKAKLLEDFDEASLLPIITALTETSEEAGIDHRQWGEGGKDGRILTFRDIERGVRPKAGDVIVQGVVSSVGKDPGMSDCLQTDVVLTVYAPSGLSKLPDRRKNEKGQRVFSYIKDLPDNIKKYGSLRKQNNLIPGATKYEWDPAVARSINGTDLYNLTGDY